MLTVELLIEDVGQILEACTHGALGNVQITTQGNMWKLDIPGECWIVGSSPSTSY